MLGKASHEGDLCQPQLNVATQCRKIELQENELVHLSIYDS